jgi:hypothetical protein
MEVFTIDKLQKAIEDNWMRYKYVFRHTIDEYEVSVAYKNISNSRPKNVTSPREIEEVEIALFRKGTWLKKKDMLLIGLKESSLFEEGDRPIAPYVSLKTVCDIINYLQSRYDSLK